MKKTDRPTEMIILNPNQDILSLTNPLLDILMNRIGKSGVSLLISFPIILIKIHLAGMIVKKRPED